MPSLKASATAIFFGLVAVALAHQLAKRSAVAAQVLLAA